MKVVVADRRLLVSHPAGVLLQPREPASQLLRAVDAQATAPVLDAAVDQRRIVRQRTVISGDAVERDVRIGHGGDQAQRGERGALHGVQQRPADDPLCNGEWQPEFRLAVRLQRE